MVKSHYLDYYHHYVLDKGHVIDMLQLLLALISEHHAAIIPRFSSNLTFRQTNKDLCLMCLCVLN